MNKEFQERPKWKKFEEYVASIQKSLTPYAKVTHDETIIGKSGVKRQVDVTVRHNLGQFNILVVIDCKDWSHPVDINDVGAFADQVDDISANKGAIICNAGFTDGAKKRASEKGIDLLTAVDPETLEWPVNIAMPTLCDFRYIESLSMKFIHSAPAPFMMPSGDPQYTEIYKEDNSFNDVLINLFIKAWNSGKLTTELGEHSNLKFIDCDAYTKVDDKFYGPVEITADIIVQRKLFFGHIPLTKGKGFMNNITGGFTTKKRGMKIDIVEIQQKWRQLNSKDELAVEPSCILDMSDVYPIIDYKAE